MTKKLFFSMMLISVLTLSPWAFADCVEACSATAAGCSQRRSDQGSSCDDAKSKCEKECKDKAGEEDDALFTGIKFQSGNTTIMSGERIGADLSAFGGGHLRPEDLVPFEKSVIYSKNAEGTVSYSKTTRQDSFLSHRREEENQETGVKIISTSVKKEKAIFPSKSWDN